MLSSLLTPSRTAASASLKAGPSADGTGSPRCLASSPLIVRGKDEIAIGEALHEGAGAETVRAVVGEVGLTDDEQPRQVAHQVVVDPEAAHRVVEARGKFASGSDTGFPR